MSHVFLDGSKSRLYMEFEKILPAAQGMGIWGDRAYVLYDTGVCGVYDLRSRERVPIAQFPLGSYNQGTPRKDYLNHANSCMFSHIHYEGNPIPLLYVVIGTGIGEDEDGFYYRCAVENIVQSVDEQGKEHYGAETMQIISYRSGGEEEMGYERPGWGCPAFLMDAQEKALYMLSSRHRSKYGCLPEGEKNTYIVTRFVLPEVMKGTFIHLTAKDIKDQFLEESNVLFTQGGTVFDGKIYYTFGLPKRDYPVNILVFDLEKRIMCAQIGNLDQAFRQEEIECCAFYEGKLLCNTTDGSIIEIII